MDMLLLGVGGDGTRTGPWWSCVAVAVVAAAQGGGGMSKEVELQKWDLRTMNKKSYTRHCNGNFGPEPSEAVKWSVSMLK